MPSRSSSSRSEAALGFRAHSGWAALVAVAGPGAEPIAVSRRRVVLSEGTPRQPFHAAEGQPFAAAEGLIGRSTEEARALAERAVKEAVAELRDSGHEPVASGLLLAAGRPLPGLREVLASHALIHAAEGELFREALRQGSRRHGLGLLEVGEREMEDRAARSLRQPPAGIQRCSRGLGEGAGPSVDPGREASRPGGLAGARGRCRFHSQFDRRARPPPHSITGLRLRRTRRSLGVESQESAVSSYMRRDPRPPDLEYLTCLLRTLRPLPSSSSPGSATGSSTAASRLALGESSGPSPKAPARGGRQARRAGGGGNMQILRAHECPVRLLLPTRR
jgi:hypothetical protein